MSPSHAYTYTHDQVSHVVNYNQQHFPCADDNAADILINNQFIGFENCFFLSFSHHLSVIFLWVRAQWGMMKCSKLFQFDISTFHGKLLWKLILILFLFKWKFLTRQRGWKYAVTLADEKIFGNDWWVIMNVNYEMIKSRVGKFRWIFNWWHEKIIIVI